MCSMGTPTHVVHTHPVLLVKSPALCTPVLKPVSILCGAHKKLHFHLFKFTRTENKVFCDNLIAKRLTDLGNTKRHLQACSLQDVFIIYINPLRSFRTQVEQTGTLIRRTHVGTEHEVKITHAREGPTTLRTGSPGRRHGNLIRAKATFTHRAINQRITEVIDVARRPPYVWMHQDCCIQPDDMIM